MTADAPNASERIKSLIEITESLSDIFDRENALLTNSRPTAIAPLQAEKARLAAAYAQSIRDIAANRSLVEGAGAALLSKLRTVTKTFEARAARQRSLLDDTRQAAEGVVEAAAEEAAIAEQQAGYTYDNKRNNAAAPVAFNESS